MRKRVIDLSISIVASAAAMALSWPYFRNFEFWAESRGMWWLYFAAGFVLAVYVLHVFLGALATLFAHDAIEHAEAAAKAAADKAAGGRS